MRYLPCLALLLPTTRVPYQYSGTLLPFSACMYEYGRLSLCFFFLPLLDAVAVLGTMGRSRIWPGIAGHSVTGVFGVVVPGGVVGWRADALVMSEV